MLLPLDRVVRTSKAAAATYDARVLGSVLRTGATVRLNKTST